MDTEHNRIELWSNKFIKYLEKDNAELVELFQGRIYWFPKENGTIEVGLTELDEYYATKEQIERMDKIIFEFASKNPV